MVELVKKHNQQLPTSISYKHSIAIPMHTISAYIYKHATQLFLVLLHQLQYVT